MILAGATLAMAHKSQLEGRLLAILDPRIPRRGLTRLRALATSAACMLAIMPLAALQPWTNEAPVQKVNAAVPDVSILRPPNVPPTVTLVPSWRRPAHMRTALAESWTPLGLSTSRVRPRMTVRVLPAVWLVA